MEWRLILKFMLFLIHQPTAISQKSIMMSLSFFTFLKMCSEMIKNGKHHKLKIKKSQYTAIFSIDCISFVDCINI